MKVWGRASATTLRPSARLLGRLAVIFVAAPAALLGVLYVASVLSGVPFGNPVFVLTGIMGLAWFVLTGSGRATLGTAGTSRIGALFEMDKEYARLVSRGELAHYATPGNILVVSTVALVLGWVVVLTTDVV